MKEKLIGLLGMVVFFAVCWLCSTNRRKIDWALVGKGTLLQLIFAFFVLKTDFGQKLFVFLNDGVMKILEHSAKGSEFLFSKVLVDPEVAGRIFGAENGFIFAFQALPILIFLSAMTAVLYHCGIMQWIVRFLAVIMQKTLRISGAEACSASANIFLGQTEAPLTVRPYIANMTRSELACVMIGGFATISGSVLGGCAAMLSSQIENVAGHFIAASVMSAPAAIVFAKILVPEEDVPITMGTFVIDKKKVDVNVVDACARGCSDGLKLALNVGAMLIGFIALISLVQWLWNGAVSLCGLGDDFTLQSIVGYLFSPFAFLLGIPGSDILVCGEILSEKTLINEFVAYGHFAQLLATDFADCAPRTAVIMSYALCGFANVSSIGIVIAGIGGMAPGRRGDISRLALRALLGGTFASFSTAIIAGMFL